MCHASPTGSWATAIFSPIVLLRLPPNEPQVARLLMAGVLALFAAFLAVSNTHQNESPSLRPMAGSPVARQHPFGSGMSPIQQLMISLYLSAAGLRFLQHPTPAEELALPSGRVTGPVGQTAPGLPCSASLRDDRGRCLLYAGACLWYLTPARMSHLRYVPFRDHYHSLRRLATRLATNSPLRGISPSGGMRLKARPSPGLPCSASLRAAGSLLYAVSLWCVRRALPFP